MVTGYTSLIQEGISFPDFVLRCARNFGALVQMRDDPIDAEIPDEIKPSEHHKDEMEKACMKLNEAKRMSLETAKVLAERDYQDALASNRKRLSEARELRDKYEAMLEKVIAWQPPTPDHEELKKFMISQIQGTIDFDCRMDYITEPERKSPEKWLGEYIDKCARDLGYHVKEWYAEVDRCKGRTEWIKALKESLKLEEVVSE